jgi:hypothetical protein
MSQLTAIRRVSCLDLEDIHTNMYLEENGTSDGHGVVTMDCPECGTYTSDEVSTIHASRLFHIPTNPHSQRPSIPFINATPSNIPNPTNQKTSFLQAQSRN